MEHQKPYYYITYVCFESFPFRQKLLFSSAKPRDFDGMLDTGPPVSMYTTKLQSIRGVWTLPNLTIFLKISVKDIYQLNYLICIKDFNAETITPLKLNLFSFFISGCQHQMKTTCLYVYVSDITLTVR